MTPEVLELLPARGIDQSLLFAVLLGLWTLFIFNELFGWVFTGLVVPGYLASVFVVQPYSGLAIVIEALLTYLLARWLSDALARTGAWNRFFGRERFFLILLLSVLVRQHAELWLLPTLGRAVFDVPIDTQQTFFGVGLVLVPLLANMFWTLNLDRSLTQVGLPLALTWALLVWVFLPLTNYDLSAIAVTYEDVAVSFLAGPKVYVILLMAAGLAAIANHRYGWEFGGILVPGLLAVAWFTPGKLLTTIGEAVGLYALVSLLLMIPRLRPLNSEGSRRIVLVFTLAFIVKLAIGWGIGDRWPGLEVTDLFGFGYLMPSLIAAKMLGRHALGRVLLPTITLSIVGFLAGNAVAGGIQLLVNGGAAPSATAAVEGPPPLGVTPQGLAAIARLRADPQAKRAPAAARIAAAQHLAAVGPAVVAWLVDKSAPPALGPLRVVAAEAETFAVFDGDGLLDLPTAWLRPGRPGPLVRVSKPFAQPEAAGGAAALCRALECRGVVWPSRDDAPLTPALRALPSTDLVQLESHPDGLDGPPTSAPAGPLRLSPAALWAMASSTPAPPATSVDAWLIERTQRADRHRPRRALTVEERAQLRRLTLDLLRPIGGPARVAWLSAQAALIGHEVRLLHGCGPGRCIGLGAAPGAESEAVTLVVREAGAPTLIEAPAPAAEPGTWRFAVALWRAADARALLVARPRSTHPDARVPRPTWAGSAFHAVHKTLLSTFTEPTSLALQVRGRSAQRPLAADALVALERPALDPGQVPASLRRVLALAPFAGLGPVAVDDGSAAYVDLVSAANAQRELAVEGGARFARVWLSERARAPYLARRLPPIPAALERRLSRLERPARAFLVEGGAAAGSTAFTEALEALGRFMATGNPLALARALDLAAATAGLEIGVGADAREPRPYLWVRGGAGPRAVLFAGPPGERWAGAVDDLPPDLSGYGLLEVRP